MVLALGRFGDIKKTRAAEACTPSGGNLQSCADGTDVTINGGTVVTSGSHTYNSLTITNGAKLTQEAIAISDIDTSKPINDPNYLNASGKNKKVDLNITGTLTLTNQGRIDVSAKGFPGGYFNHIKGYGPGGGCSINKPFEFSGGGHGGSATSNICSNGGASYGLENTPEENGSGGGLNDNGNVPGAAGGGIIKINATYISLDQNDQTFISANGEGSDASVAFSGGGAGGSIWISATNLTTSYPFSGPPSAIGNNYTSLNGTIYSGSDGTVNGAPADFGKYIVANGGKTGGAGGRIKINITNPINFETCHITGGSAIPAYCENQDVTIDSTTVNADEVKITEGTTSECTDPNVANCDSKRKFASLKIINSGVLTHIALVPTTDFSTSTNELTNIGKTKKVDLVVTGDIILESGGKIDVSGKGYPGGTIPSCSINIGNNYVNAYGRGRGKFAEGSAGGYGFGSGGGFAGIGGDGYSSDVTGYIVAGGNYTLPLSYSDGDWGSGGGAAHDHKWTTTNYTGCSNGGPGGGKIILDVKGKIDFKDGTSSIKANGGDMTIQLQQRDAFGGGGSGGSIIIKTSSIVYEPSSYSNAQAIGGFAKSDPPFVSYVKNGLDGTIRNSLPITLQNISANGGGGGGGGGGGLIVIGAGTGPSRKVQVEVTWTENGQTKSVKFSEILGKIK